MTREELKRAADLARRLEKVDEMLGAIKSAPHVAILAGEIDSDGDWSEIGPHFVLTDEEVRTFLAKWSDDALSELDKLGIER